MASNVNRVLVYGGKGALGAVCVKYFKSQNWWVGAIDFMQNDEADINILVKPNDLWTDQSQQVISDVEQALKGEKVNAIICVAGGWAGGNAETKDFIKNSDLMWKQSVWTSATAAHLSTKFLKEDGFLSLTGAKAALESTPGMIGYGFAKAAVHHLVSSLADDKSGLPNGSVVAAVLPITLDTPMNRKWMPKADHSSWTPLETVAELFFDWAVGKNRPKTGSLIQLITKDGHTEFVPA